MFHQQDTQTQLLTHEKYNPTAVIYVQYLKMGAL